jgi:hypothetical protein
MMIPVIRAARGDKTTLLKLLDRIVLGKIPEPSKQELITLRDYEAGAFKRRERGN